MRASSYTPLYILFAGDALTLAIVTLFGFASHGTLGTAGSRMLTTFVPLMVAWLLLGPHLRVFDITLAVNFQQLWRPFWAMILAAPMAALLRGLWLGAPILPVFVLVLGGIAALALLVWRGVFWFVLIKVGHKNG